MEAAINLPRPRWTKRNRQEIREERKALGLNEQGAVRLIDVSLALRILGSQQEWRKFTFELSLNIFLLVILLIYALGSRFINSGYFIGKSVDLEVNQIFNLGTVTYDLNTPLNTSEQLFFTGDGLINLNPLTFQPIINNDTLNYERCLANGIPVDDSSAAANGSETGWCLRFKRPKRFIQVRSIEGLSAWVTHMLNRSTLFSTEQNLSGRKLILLGTIRIRQLRSEVAHQLVQFTSQEQTSPIRCSDGTSNVMALRYQTTSQLSTFPNPTKVTEAIVGMPSAPILSARLNFYYPADGYAFDLPRCQLKQIRDTWRTLTASCDWISEQFTSTVFVTFTGYDPVSDSYVFTKLTFEKFPQGTRLTTSDIRVFRIPGGSSDYAYAARIVLCAVSLAELTFFLLRALKRGPSSLDRWLLLDMSSLIIIQSAVWIGISTSLQYSTQQISSPEAIGALSSCDYPYYVDQFDSISYNEKVQDLLLGIALILQGLKFFQLCQLSSKLSAAYSIINAVGLEILWWLILTSCIFFFFAFGANFLFGAYTPYFLSLPTSFVSTFLIFSKIPKFSPYNDLSATGFSDNPDIFGAEFWATFEKPNLSWLIWELAEYVRPYEANVIFGFAFWLGLLIVIVYWNLRNLLLGVVLSGYETIRRDIEAEEIEASERMQYKDTLDSKRQKHSRLKLIAYKTEELIWRVWNNAKVNQLLLILQTDPYISRRKVITSVEMKKIFKDVGIIKKKKKAKKTESFVGSLAKADGITAAGDEADDDDDEGQAKSGDVLSDSRDPGEWFQANFFENFEFILSSVDEATYMLNQQENPFALSTSNVQAIREQRSLDDAISTLYEKFESEFSFYSELPTVQQMKSAQVKPLEQQYLKAIMRQIAIKTPDLNSTGVMGSTFFFDIQAVTLKLCVRMSDQDEALVNRLLEHAILTKAAAINGGGDSSGVDTGGAIGNGTVGTMNATPSDPADEATEIVYSFCLNVLFLKFSAVPEQDQIKSYICRELHRARRHEPESRASETVIIRLCDIFGSSIMGWKSMFAGPSEILRSRERFDQHLLFGDDDTRDVEARRLQQSESRYSLDSSSEEKEDSANVAVENNNIHALSTATSGVFSSTTSKRTENDGNDTSAAETDIDDFDPRAQFKWEDAVVSGDLLLSLVLLHGLRSFKLTDVLEKELAQLERKHRQLAQELITCQRLLDEKISKRKPLQSQMRDIAKHGIEPHPQDKTYHVHFTSSVTKEYRFIGVFTTQEDAEQAMTKTILQDAKSAAESPGGHDEDGFLSSKQFRDSESWEEDDRHYYALAKESKERKRLEKIQRHKGSLAMGSSVNDQNSQQEDDDTSQRDGEDDDDEDGEDENGSAGAKIDAAGRNAPSGSPRGAAAATGRPLPRRMVDATVYTYERLVYNCGHGWFMFQRWLNRNSDTLLVLDTVDNVWRDAHGNAVKVSSKPKTVAPLAGNRYAQLTADQK